MQNIEYEKEIASDILKSAYSKGYSDGKSMTAAEREQIFNHGLDAAWEAAIWILKCRSEEEYQKVNKFFNVRFTNDIFNQFSPSEVVKKIREFEEYCLKHHDEAEEHLTFKVGDEIEWNKSVGVVTESGEDSFDLSVICSDGTSCIWPKAQCKPTGRNFGAVPFLLEQLRTPAGNKKG